MKIRASKTGLSAPNPAQVLRVFFYQCDDEHVIKGYLQSSILLEHLVNSVTLLIKIKF